MPTVKQILSELPPPLNLWVKELENKRKGFQSMGITTSLAYPDVFNATVKCYLTGEQRAIAQSFYEAIKRDRLYRSLKTTQRNSYVRNCLKP